MYKNLSWYVSLLFILMLFILLPNSVHAQSPGVADAFKKSALREQLATNSALLFWPISPGKTMDHPLYFIKGLFEAFREKKLSGDAELADYKLLLGSKKLLEAEQLLKNKKDNLAIKTLDLSLKELSLSMRSWDVIKESNIKVEKGILTEKSHVNLINGFSNIYYLSSYLATQYQGETKEKIERVKEASKTALKELNY